MEATITLPLSELTAEMVAKMQAFFPGAVAAIRLQSPEDVRTASFRSGWEDAQAGRIQTFNAETFLQSLEEKLESAA